ncbi:MAG: hypothetical protein QM708_15340 [Propioniciclava sp.]|uniref:hypothetical protein n=1 Tax=Propioniciclava sp. TaxID=2038686 RepID=UPI0039E2D36A
MDLRDLPRPVRAELRGLTQELAEIVGAHLLKAGELIGTDPQLAYAHAEAARRRAARLSVTREAAGEAAYAAGEYQIALHEFRALRRMNGGTEFVAAMADCERALGRPDKALKLVREGLDAKPDFNQRVELRLVEAGARTDLGQVAEALRLLKHEIEASAGRGSRGARARLRYGYADLLETTGDAANAERWFAAAAALDEDGETDAGERVAALQGLVLEVDEDALVGDDPVIEDESDAAEDEADVAEDEADPADDESESSTDAADAVASSDDAEEGPKEDSVDAAEGESESSADVADAIASSDDAEDEANEDAVDAIESDDAEDEADEDAEPEDAAQDAEPDGAEQGEADASVEDAEAAHDEREPAADVSEAEASDGTDDDERGADDQA